MRSKPYCSVESFEKLKTSGLTSKIKDSKEWYRMILYNIFSEELPEIISRPKNEDLKKTLHEIVQKAEKLDDYELQGDKLYDFFMTNPLLLAYAAIGDYLEQFKEFSFNSINDLATAVSASCIADENYLKNDKTNGLYQWRNKEYNTELSNENHGDMSLLQKKLPKEGIYGPAFFTTGFGGGQYGWTPFLLSILKYAQKVDALDIDEIKDWKSHVTKYSSFWGRISSTNYTELNWTVENLLKDNIIEENKTNHPLRCALGDISTYPCLESKNLVFITPSKDGNYQPNTSIPLFQNQKAVVKARFFEEDLPHIMKGIYKLYARDRSELVALMNYFVK